MFDVKMFTPKASVQESTMTLGTSFASDKGHSYFVEAMEFLTSLNEEMVEGDRSLYAALCESNGNDALINEAFSEWYDYVKKIIAKVLDFLKAILNKFLVGINMMIKRESYLKAHEKDIMKFDDDNHKFNMKVFNFTFDNACPSSTVLTTYEKSLEGIQSMLTDRSTDKDTKVDVGTAYDNYIDSLNGDYYDEIRAKVMGLPQGSFVDSADYASELFKIFRDGDDTKEEKEILHADVTKSLSCFKSYETIKNQTTKQRNTIEKEYKAIEKAIDTASKKDKNGLSFAGVRGGEKTKYTLAQDAAAKYDMFIKAKANEIHEISNIHTLAFGAKLDALKDCFNQDKTILYKALYRVLGNIKTGVRD